VRPVASLIVAAWPALVVAGAWQHRPRRRLLLPAAPSEPGAGPPPPSSTAVRRSVRLTARLGRPLRAIAGRPPDGSADAIAGLALLATVALAVLALPLAPLPGLAAAVLPAVRRRAAARAERDAIGDELPQVVDLFVLATGGGLTVPLALDAVASRCHGPVGRALGAAARRITLGQLPADALEGVLADTSDATRPLIAVLVAAERYGAPLAGPLERVAAEVRLQSRRRAEEAARRVPVKLLFPLVLCTLPAFALLTVVPLLISAFGSLRL